MRNSAALNAGKTDSAFGGKKRGYPPRELGGRLSGPIADRKPPSLPGPDEPSGRRAWAVRYVATLWSPLVFFGIGVKLAKAGALAHASSRGLGLQAVVAVASSEILFYGVGFLAWTALLGSRWWLVRTASTLALHLCVPLLFCLLAAEHAFFRTSGAIADWYLLKDAIRGFPQLLRLYKSQLTPGLTAMLAVVWVFSIGIYGLRRHLLRPLDSDDTVPPRRRRLTAWWLVAVLAAASSLVDPPEEVAVLSRSVLGRLMTDAAEDALRARHESHSNRLLDAAATAIGPRALTAGTSRRPPNVVIVAMESVGATSTSLYGGPYDTTPFLKELSSRGALIERAYAVVPHTSKELVALLCGVYPKLLPGADEADQDAIPARCLPALLQEHGYATAFFQPAEENYERRSDLARAMGYAHFAGKESLDGTGFDESSYFGWEDDALIAPVARWLEVVGAQPFFLTLLTLTSHHPYSLPRGVPARTFTESPVLNEHLNTVAYTDRFLRKMFRRFEERGLMENTVFVIVGDHGEAFGQHARWQHDAVPYEEGVRVPMILVGPGIVPRKRISGLRQVTDVAPTVTRLLGFEATPSFVGEDLLSSKGHEMIFAACYLKDYCMTTIEGWMKVVHHFGRLPDQMFNLLKDPDEQDDLLRAGDANSAAMHRRTLQRMTDIVSETNALYERRARVRTPLFVSRTRPGVQVTEIKATFEDFAEMVGFDLAPPSTRPGGSVVVTLVFHVLQKPPPGWDLFLHLDGSRSINADHVPVHGTYPLSRWEPGDFIVDRYTVSPRPAAEPERFHVRTGFWQRDSGARAQVTAEAPLIVTTDRTLELGTIDVNDALVDREALVTTSPPARQPADIRFGGLVRLLSAEPDRRTVKAGLKVTTTCVFQPLATLGSRFELRIQLEGPTPRTETHSPLAGMAPLDTWRPGQYVRDRHVLITKTGDRAGDYRVMLTLFDTERGTAVRAKGRGLPITDGRVQIAAYTLVP